MASTRARLEPGQDILVTGATGALGIAAIQLCHILGAGTVLGTTSAAQKRERLRELGYDHVLDSNSAELAAEVRELTRGEGVDVVLDAVGGDLFTQGLQALRPGGTIVTVAQLAGTVVPFDIGYFYLYALNVMGGHGASRAEQELMVRLFAEGKTDPVIAKVLPLADAAEAHRRVESREQVGRIMLVP